MTSWQYSNLSALFKYCQFTNIEPLSPPRTASAYQADLEVQQEVPSSLGALRLALGSHSSLFSFPFGGVKKSAAN
jgi:hypothetical protein